MWKQSRDTLSCSRVPLLAYLCVFSVTLSSTLFFTGVPVHQLSKLLMIFVELEWHPGVHPKYILKA